MGISNLLYIYNYYGNIWPYVSAADPDQNPDPSDPYVFWVSWIRIRIQRHGSADQDPDPHQNFMDLQHCLLYILQ